MSVSVEKPEIIIISVDGNIGSGKTTMVGYMRERFKDVYFVDEPVGEWIGIKDKDDRNILEKFYSDRTRWSYTFQNVAFLTRFMNIQKSIQMAIEEHISKASLEKKSKIVIITERCLLTDRYVFARMLYDDGSITELEWNLYLMWYESLTKYLDIKVDGIIYVNTDPITCRERIAKRARSGEEIISQKYLDSLHEYHQNWLKDYSGKLLEIESEKENLDQIRDFILTFL